MVSPPNSRPKNVLFEWAPNYWPAGGAHTSPAGPVNNVDIGRSYVRDTILTFRREGPSVKIKATI